MRTNHFALAAAGAFLTLAPAAQEGGSTGTSTTPLFQLKTTNPFVAMGLAQGLDTGIAGEGPLTVFSLDDGGALHAQAMDGTSDMIEIVCSPRMLAVGLQPGDRRRPVLKRG